MLESRTFAATAILVFFIITCVCGKFVGRLESSEDGLQKLSLHKEAEDGKVGKTVCSATTQNSFLINGWDVFQVETYSEGNTDVEQALCAGQAEGESLTTAIWNFYYNNVRTYCKGQKKACKKVKAFLRENWKWMNTTIGNSMDSAIWYQANLFVAQVNGLYTGYENMREQYQVGKITLEEFIIMNLQTDLDDVFDALSGDVSAKVKGRSRCSALIKLLPENEDLLVAHNTWTSYVQMNRAVKLYDFAFQTSSNDTTVIPGSQIAFSGYPGVITSGDDFYITSAGLAAIETTIGNSNSSLWVYVQPTGQLFESIRSLVAMRLASNGKDWCEIFSQFNSGTYNNQWMIVDYNKFTQKQKPKAGTLYILEQIPGYVRYADETKVLKSQTYWPSYNLAFYQDIFDLSGNQQLVDEYGDWYSYDGAPRAKIFKRDHSTVTDVDSMMTLMRSNDYKNDEYAKCNCTPPYSGENAIAARSDLNPKNGSYPFEALGHRCHGAIDAKIVSSVYLKNMTFIAVSGPTTGNDLPEFNWQTTDYKHQPHLGQPDTFTKFTPEVTPWQPWD